MTRQQKVWALLVGAPTAVELWAWLSGREEWTLSPQLRTVFRCGTRPGNALTALSIGGSAAWLAHHLQTLPPPRA